MLRVQAHGRSTATRPASAFRAIPSRNAGKLANRGTTGFPKHVARHRLQPEATAAADVATAMSTNTSAEVSPQSGQPFAWERNWWPVHVVDYLDPLRPTPVELLGMQLVLWRDAAGAWRCFRDSCPHRRVPLSEGRVEGGELVCSYHGWRFNEEGACTAIPQAPDAKSLAAATASPRSCVASFPTQEACGLLWVWPDSGPEAAAAASAVQLPLPNAFTQEAYKQQLQGGWFLRYMPYDFDVLLENVADPSHVPFSHHGSSPTINRHNAPPIPFQALAGPRLQEESDADLLPSGQAPAWAYQFPNARSSNNRILFHPPGLIVIHTLQQLVNIIYAVPAGPGRSIFITSAAFAGPPMAPLSLVAALAGNPAEALPKWHGHLGMLKFFDGDIVFLNAQGHFLRAQERQAASAAAAAAAAAADVRSTTKSAWEAEYFMPMTSDKGLAAARKWLDTVGRGGPVYPAEVSPTTPLLPREQLLDRRGQHVRHCPKCRKALETSAQLQTAGSVLVAAAFFALCCLAGAHGFKALLSGGLPSVGAAATVACGLLAVRLQSAGRWLERQLTFVDYVHADIP